MNGLQHLLQILYWFHPLVWLAGKEAMHHREMAVDEAVIGIRKGLLKHTYEKTMLLLSEQTTACSFPALMGILEPRSFLFRRVVHLMDDSWNKVSRFTAVINWATVVIFICFLLPMGVSSPVVAEVPKIEKKEELLPQGYKSIVPGVGEKDVDLL